MTKLAHIADRVLNRPLLLLPDKAAVIMGVLSGRIGVDGPDASRFEGDRVPERDEQGNPRTDQWGYAKYAPYKVADGVAIISIVGSLVNRGAWIGASSGLTSYEGIQHQLKRAAADGQVHSILLDIHSPGGEAIGAFETAGMVREIAKSKKVVAVVNGMAASAGYAIASGASEIITTRTGLSGSIGVLMMHVDYSEWLKAEGVKPTLIFAGAHKVDGNAFEPLSDGVKSDIQAEVNEFYGLFLETVADGRGERLTAEAARKTEARTFVGEAAVRVGLADRVGSFETVLSDLTRAPGRSSSSQKGRSMSENNGAPAAEQQNAGFTQAQLDQAVASAVAQASADADKRLAAERDRIASLDALLTSAGPGATDIISKAKSDGTSAADAALAILTGGAHLEGRALENFKADDAAAGAAVPTAPGGAAKASTPDSWKAEWSGSAALQGEFPSAEAYAAFKKNEAKTGGAK